MTTKRSVALVGARGYVGQELIGLLAQDADFEIAFATSREASGVKDVGGTEVLFETLTPDEIAARRCDAYVLGLPNGLAGPYVEAIEKATPDSVIVDLSTDHRHRSGWRYGLPEIASDSGRGAKRIANPGCYATAAILALWPIRGQISGTPSVVGMSGYSGAGTTPSDKNDPDRLRDNIIPYGFGGHAHQAEISVAIGHSVAFAPHVTSFFRGLLITAMAPLTDPSSAEKVMEIFQAAYNSSEPVKVQAEPPEPQTVANTPDAVVGGFALDPDTNVLTVSCALDNLQKGAASQALTNLRASFALS